MFISIIVTMIVFFIALLGLSIWAMKDKSNKTIQIVSWGDGFIYHFFIFMAMVLYGTIVIVCPNIDALLSIVLLIFSIRLTNKIALKLVNKDNIAKTERKKSVVVSAIGIIAMMVCMAIAEKNSLYLLYIVIVISVVMGFYVSLEDLVEDNTLAELKEKVCDEIKLDEIEKKRVIAMIGVIAIIVSAKYVGDGLISEIVRNGIQIGMVLGGVLFIAFVLFAMNIWPKEEKIRMFCKKIRQNGEIDSNKGNQKNFSLVLFIVLVILDSQNVLSTIVKTLGLYPAMAVLMALILVSVKHFNLLETLKLPIRTDADILIDTVAGAGALYALYETTILCCAGMGEFYWHKLIGSAAIVCCCILLKRIRKQKITGDKKKNNITVVNTCSMKQLYDGSFPEKGETLILLEEEAAEYDLLERTEIIEDITRTISHCIPNKKFVISLVGNWGSGKTTILNIAKKQLATDETLVVIDDFDPWNYEDEEALFGAMLDAIFSHSGITYNMRKVQIWKRDLQALVFNSNSITKGIKLSFSENGQKTVAMIKEMMNDYLAISNRKIVFFIDNVERLEDRNILLLLKTVADILDLNKVIYVLSFDMRRMNVVLEDCHLGKDYLKKIVQMEFFIPEIDKDVKCHIFSRCIENLMKFYHVDEKTMSETMKSVPMLMEYMTDIRDMKRFINSVINILYSFSGGEEKHLAGQLNVLDYIILELLRSENVELYRTIWHNPKYFVSSNREAMFQEYLMFEFRKEKMNKEANEFFDTLFSKEENKRFENLMGNLFPYIQRYSEGHDILDSGYYGIQEESYEEVIRRRRIYSGNYFPIYFTRRMNGHLDIQKGIIEYIELVNYSKKEGAKKCLEELCKKYEGTDQTVVFTTLQIYLKDLNQQGWEVVFWMLYDMVAQLDDSLLFFHLNSRTRAEYIVSLALEKISDDAYNDFLLYIQQDYKQMYVLQSIIRNKKVEGSDETKELQYEGRMAEIYEELKQMGNRVVEQKIDLYKDDYYRERNIWGWYHAVKYNMEMDIKNAFRFMLTGKNIYRFLWDMTTKSYGGMYGYFLNKNNFESLCDFKDIEKLMQECQPETEDEAFVYRLYEEYKRYNGSREAEVYQSTERRMTML